MHARGHYRDLRPPSDPSRLIAPATSHGRQVRHDSVPTLQRWRRLDGRILRRPCAAERECMTQGSACGDMLNAGPPKNPPPSRKTAEPAFGKTPTPSSRLTASRRAVTPPSFGRAEVSAGRVRLAEAPVKEEPRPKPRAREIAARYSLTLRARFRYYSRLVKVDARSASTVRERRTLPST